MDLCNSGLTRKLEMESREDEARMWSILAILRFPDADAFYNQGVLLNKMCCACIENIETFGKF